MLNCCFSSYSYHHHHHHHHQIFILFNSVRGSSFTRFLDHTQRRTTVSRTPLDEWSARRTDLYLTTLTTDRHQCTRWDSNPQSQQASGRRPTRGHWDWQLSWSWWIQLKSSSLLKLTNTHSIGKAETENSLILFSSWYLRKGTALVSTRSPLK